MKIEPGYYRTRDGRKARVLCLDRPDKNWPASGYIHSTESITEDCTWDLLGNNDMPGDERGGDLISPWTDPPKLATWYRVKAVRAGPSDDWIYAVSDWSRSEKLARDEYNEREELLLETMEAPE